MRCAGIAVRRANNARELGIQAVSARIANGTLKIVESACPRLVSEFRLYAFKPAEDGAFRAETEGPDHALDALRYLISKLDWRRMARTPIAPSPIDSASDAAPPPPPPAKPKRPWLSVHNEQLWTRIYPSDN